MNQQVTPPEAVLQIIHSDNHPEVKLAALNIIHCLIHDDDENTTEPTLGGEATTEDPLQGLPEEVQDALREMSNSMGIPLSKFNVVRFTDETEEIEL